MSIREEIAILRKDAPQRIELARGRAEKGYHRYAEQVLGILEGNEDIDAMSSFEVLADFLRACSNVATRNRPALVDSGKFDSMFPPAEPENNAAIHSWLETMGLRRARFILMLEQLGDVGLRILNDELKRRIVW